MTTDARVLIAGAGPAGSIAAYELARRGHPVLILEKSEFPRYKVCGAGLTVKILKELPFDVSPVLDTRIHTIIFSTGFRHVFSRTSSDPMIYCSDRDRFDDFLLAKAREAGATVMHGTRVREVIPEEGRVLVRTDRNIFSAELMVGADGASGVTARFAGLRNHIASGMAWEAEVRVGTGLVQALKQTVFLDWGSFPGGYGWVFPKGDHLSIGVGGPATLSKHMMPYYRRMMHYLGLDGIDAYSLKSWPIPVKTCHDRFHNGRILVAGDAAGLTDPLTGEGIYYAVRSGKMAGEACSDYLDGKSGSLDTYSDRVNGELMPELLEADRIRAIFNTAPLRIHSFVRDSDRAWRAFARILRGERRYADVPSGFGRWEPFWGAAARLAGRISDRREKNFAKKGFK
ncbi:MAG TPA: geranylgeranyl reductase family protein [Bacteroidales bacterium]|nr:geranylgeranyl reductase family protein [Bacteroidales bacterium]